MQDRTHNAHFLHNWVDFSMLLQDVPKTTKMFPQCQKMCTLNLLMMQTMSQNFWICVLLGKKSQNIQRNLAQHRAPLPCQTIPGATPELSLSNCNTHIPASNNLSIYTGCELINNVHLGMPSAEPLASQLETCQNISNATHFKYMIYVYQ